MDWSSLVPSLAKFAVPAIKVAITAGVGAIPIVGGFAAPFVADAVGNMIAQAFGTAPDPVAVAAAIEAAPPAEALAKLQAVEAETTAKWPELAKIAKAEEATAQVQIVNTTQQMKQEILSASDLTPDSKWKTAVLVMNAVWRPLFALEWLLECMGFSILFASTLITSDQFDVDAIVKLWPLISLYMAARFGLIGYHMNLRTREKETVTAAVTDSPPPVSMDDIKNMLRKGGVKLK